MNNIYIVCERIYDRTSNKFSIGGVQTYVQDLVDVASLYGKEAIICQIGGDNYTEDIVNGKKIITFPLVQSLWKSYNQATFNHIYERLNASGVLFVISTDQMDIKCEHDNVITIQHGVAFDIPGTMIGGIWGKARFLQNTNKAIRCWKNVCRLNNTPNTVCVDYNYYNWYRTLGTIYDNHNIWVVPNYTKHFISKEDLNIKLKTQNKTKKIVFARRFVDYRGTLLFANVIERIFEDGFDVDVTFAGEGPLLNKVKNLFSSNERVKFTSFKSDESTEFHKDYDIAVVPTIFSEGTSLSLIEAMAAGCYPIATHVGGMTNILIDGFNGTFVSPDENSLYRGLKKVLSIDDIVFNSIVNNAYQTVTTAFSYKKWGQEWNNIWEEM